MIARRCLFAAIPALLALPAHADDTDAARDLVVTLGRRLTEVANTAATAEARRAAFETLLESAADIESIARFCLGRFWRTATPEQQRVYTKLFRTVLLRNIAGRAGEYKGVVMEVGKAQRREDDIVVSSIVNRPGNAPNKIDWIVTATGAPRLIDVVAEGTSLRLTQRSDYSAFLGSHGNKIDILIEALKAQAAAPG